MNKNYQALENWVFVEEEKQVRSYGVFEIPEGLDADYTFGTVVSAGEGTYENGIFIGNPLHVGDYIVFPRTAGSKINFVEGMELISVRACDVLAKAI